VAQALAQALPSAKVSMVGITGVVQIG